MKTYSPASKTSVLAGAIALAATGTALAKPPLQLGEGGVLIEPLAIATARIESGKFIFGEWQEYVPVQARGARGYYYIYDCFGGYVLNDLSKYVYVNRFDCGTGVDLDVPRLLWDTGCPLGGNRWYLGADYVCPVMVQSIQELAPGATGGTPIDAIDVAWHWGGGECTIAFVMFDDPALCGGGDPLQNEFSDILVAQFGDLEAGRSWVANINGIWKQFGVFLPVPKPGGSFLAALLNANGSPNVRPGTQFMLWGTGDVAGEPFRAGIRYDDEWWDDRPADGEFSPDECNGFSWESCPLEMGACIGILAARCPADVNFDGFVNGNDYDIFANWYENCRALGYCEADVNGDGFANADDFDLFVSWFEQGC